MELNMELNKEKVVQEHKDHLVLVYGSLKQGFNNHYLLENSTHLGSHITKPKFTMRSLGGFPAIFKGGDTPILGELYRVDNTTFKRLDLLEGYPSFYDRTTVDTEHGKAWIYFITNEKDYERSSIVQNGEWL